MFGTEGVLPDAMLFYSDEQLEHSLASKLQVITGICNGATKSILLTSAESDVEIKKGQVLGSLSSVVQLPEPEESDQTNNTAPDEMVQQMSFPELSNAEAKQVAVMLERCKTIFSMGD